MTVRGVATFLALVLSACGGGPRRATTCDQMGRGWELRPDVDFTREELQAQCRAEAWKPQQIACVDREAWPYGCLSNSANESMPFIGEECPAVRRALLSAPSRFEDDVGARLADDEVAGVSYLESKLRFPHMDCAIKDEYAIRTTSLVCERTYDTWDAGHDEYVRVRALLDPPCLDDPWQGEERTAEGNDYTLWSEGAGFDAPHVFWILSAPDDDGGATVKLVITNRIEAP